MDLTSLSLLERAKSGSNPDWDRLVALYQPLVYNWLRRHGLTHHAAEELTQDVLVVVLRELGDFAHPGRPGAFRGWLRVILRNKVHDHFRRLGREPGGEGGTEAQLRFAHLSDPGPAEEGSDDATERQFLRRCCETIRPEFHDRTWQAFWATAVEGRSAPDVAADLGMTPVGVRVAKKKKPAAAKAGGGG